jgi:hypothetical protein
MRDEVLREIDLLAGETIHNMILGDRVVRHLSCDDALSFTAHIYDEARSAIRLARPDVVIGGFDGVLSGAVRAAARREGVTWYGMHFSTIPRGLATFCRGSNPSSAFSVRQSREVGLTDFARRTRREFLSGELRVPAAVSVLSWADVVVRFPGHVLALSRGLRAKVTGDFYRFADVPVGRQISNWVRKRKNLLTLPSNLATRPPKYPFILFGFHLQPESSLDVWAPFYSDQFHFVEMVARSLPATHRLLVKLHKSDADNYSRSQLRRLTDLPGVVIVAATANSREFVESASAIVAIQGTMALEGGLLGKPVVMFGSSRVSELPSARYCPDVTLLPALLREMLASPIPEESEIVAGFARYLSVFQPACYNDWSVMPSEDEVANVAILFDDLGAFMRDASGESSLGQDQLSPTVG